MAPKKTGKKKGGMILLLPLVLIGAAFLKFVFLFVFLGLLPSAVAYYVDGSKKRRMFRVILLCNLSGMLPFLPDLFHPAYGMSHANAVLLNVYSWLVVYTAAGFGWILVWFGPYIVSFVLDNTHEARALHLEHLQRKLREEWGDDVAKVKKDG